MVCLAAVRTTRTAYASPKSPQAASAAPAFETAVHGALTIADTSSTAQKCTMVGVPKARIVAGPVGLLPSDMRVITTNCRPVSAAAEEPTIT